MDSFSGRSRSKSTQNPKRWSSNTNALDLEGMEKELLLNSLQNPPDMLRNNNLSSLISRNLCGDSALITGGCGGNETAFPSTLLNFKPQFKTLVPPLHVGTNELHWMHPSQEDHIRQLLLVTTETDLDVDGPLPENELQRRKEACQIFTQALDEPLPFALRQTLVSFIESTPEIVNSFPLTNENLPGLVRHNPNVAIPVFLILMAQKDISDLLDALVEMELSINTMEVVNRLANTLVPDSQEKELPRPFLHLYISNSMEQCRKSTGINMQNRQARLVCVFLQSLFQNRIIDIQMLPAPLLYMIEAFCVEFTRIREATTLFSYIHQLESYQTVMEDMMDKVEEVKIGETQGNGNGIDPDDGNSSQTAQPKTPQDDEDDSW